MSSRDPFIPLFPGIHNYQQSWKRVAFFRDKNELFFETLIAHLELKSKSGAMIGPEGGTTACRKHAASYHSSQVFTVLRRVVHPRHVSNGEVGVHTDLAGATGEIIDLDGLQFCYIIGRKAQGQFYLDSQMLHGPLNVAFADREDEAVDGSAISYSILEISFYFPTRIVASSSLHVNYQFESLTR